MGTKFYGTYQKVDIIDKKETTFRRTLDDFNRFTKTKRCKGYYEFYKGESSLAKCTMEREATLRNYHG